MALINTTTTGVLGSTFFADGTGALNVQQNGVTLGVYGNIPAFSVTQASGQTINNATWTKLTFNSEQFDTNNNFDATTNYRFTPTVAGYYNITISGGHNTSTTPIMVAIYRNGSSYQQATAPGLSGSFDPNACVSALVLFNGTTDYVEGYVFSGATVTSQSCRFSGALIKAT